MTRDAILIESSPAVATRARNELLDDIERPLSPLLSSSPRLPSPSKLLTSDLTSSFKQASQSPFRKGVHPGQTRSFNTRATSQSHVTGSQRGRKDVAAEVPCLASSSPGRVPFTEIVGNFGYRPERLANGEAPAKRARTSPDKSYSLAVSDQNETLGQLVLKPSEISVNAKITKSPKKRLPTITGLATAAYRAEGQENEISATMAADAAALRKTVAAAKRASKAKPVTAKTPKRAPKAAPARKERKVKEKVTPKGASKGTMTTEPKTKTAAKSAAQPAAKRRPRVKKTVVLKESEPRSPLQSPEIAVDRMWDQEFLFGTSSQLAMPESPTFVKQVQEAVKQSEVLSQAPSSKSGLANSLASRALCVADDKTKNELWARATRDLNGGLIRNLPGATRKPKRLPLPLPPVAEAVEEAKDVQSAEVAVISTEAIGEPAPSPSRQDVLPAKVDSSPPKFISTPERISRATTTVIVDEISDDETPPTPSPRRRLGGSPSTIQPLRLSPSKTEVSAIAIATPLSSPDKEKAKGPAKDKVGPETPLALATTAYLKSSDTQWSSVGPPLFRRITQTVRSTPPSADLSRPTWHEKILLYDPIVVDDLAAWLNEQGVSVPTLRRRRKTASTKASATTAGSSRKPKTSVKAKRKKSVEEVDEAGVGAGETADAAQRLEGAAGKVHDFEHESEDVETVDEAVQPWMVQKWCEERSICCVYKESLRGGSRARY